MLPTFRKEDDNGTPKDIRFLEVGCGSFPIVLLQMLVLLAKETRLLTRDPIMLPVSSVVLPYTPRLHLAGDGGHSRPVNIVTNRHSLNGAKLGEFFGGAGAPLGASALLSSLLA